jgi:hypothetical protein
MRSRSSALFGSSQEQTHWRPWTKKITLQCYGEWLETNQLLGKKHAYMGMGNTRI